MRQSRVLHQRWIAGASSRAEGLLFKIAAITISNGTSYVCIYRGLFLYRWTRFQEEIHVVSPVTWYHRRFLQRLLQLMLFFYHCRLQGVLFQETVPVHASVVTADTYVGVQQN